MSIKKEDYSKSLKKKGDDVFVFLDPPYYKVTKGLYGKYGDWEKKTSGF